MLLSSGKVALAEGDLEDFEEKLGQVCYGLAEDVVRNGEGTTHVMKVCMTCVRKSVVYGRVSSSKNKCACF